MFWVNLFDAISLLYRTKKWKPSYEYFLLNKKWIKTVAITFVFFRCVSYILGSPTF